jgi:hypothetical protein
MLPIWFLFLVNRPLLGLSVKAATINQEKFTRAITLEWIPENSVILDSAPNSFSKPKAAM